jgi:preprotein translocase subunit SecF
MSSQPKKGLAWRLYHGETAFDFMGRRNHWFALSAIVILVGLGALGVRGLNFGIDFRGGTSWEAPAHGISVASARSALHGLVPDATIQTVGTDLRVEAKVSTTTTTDDVKAELAKLTKSSADAVVVNSVGPTWGREISTKATRALVIFLVVIFGFIWFRFSEWKMSVAAIAALIHDILVTVGVYAIFGFPVTPATVIAFLTILGYSLYDTVVVFDKVDENTKGLAASGRMTYSDTVNLSMNQVLMRSLNTSFVAILPIFSILIIGSQLLGATTLREFGLALFVGLLTGAYSSIFIASPLLAMLKEREQRYATIRQRIEARGAAGLLLTPAAAAAAGSSAGSSAGAGGSDRVSRREASRATARPPARGPLRPKAAAVDYEDDDGYDDDIALDDEPVRPPAPANRPRPAANPRPRANGSRPAPKGRKKGKRR